MTDSVTSLPRQDMAADDEPYQVMVVEDSVVVRGLICRALEADPRIEIVSSVGNGQRAIDAIRRWPADVVVLDVEMPVMDGLTALPKIIETCPHTKVIMASTLTVRNAEISLRALAAGAVDYLTKPSSTGELHAADDFKSELIAKVKALGAAARRDLRFASGEPSVPTPAGGGATAVPASTRPAAPAMVLRPMPPAFRPSVIAIGSSTGGPRALMQVLASLDAGLQLPVLVTQHMPPTFTAILAEHVGRAARLPSAEGEDGEPIVGGRLYIAPGGCHMTVQRSEAGAVIRLSDGPLVNFCRPAVDPMMDSIVDIYGAGVLSVILTGMGRDGAEGCKRVAEAGGVVIAQDERTSVVWGMPGAAVAEGACNAVLPLAEIGPLIRDLAIRPAA